MRWGSNLRLSLRQNILPNLVGCSVLAIVGISLREDIWPDLGRCWGAVLVEMWPLAVVICWLCIGLISATSYLLSSPSIIIAHIFGTIFARKVPFFISLVLTIFSLGDICSISSLTATWNIGSSATWAYLLCLLRSKSGTKSGLDHSPYNLPDLVHRSMRYIKRVYELIV